MLIRTVKRPMVWGLALWAAGSAAALCPAVFVPAAILWTAAYRRRKPARRRQLLCWLGFCFLAGMLRRQMLLAFESRIFTEPKMILQADCTVETEQASASGQKRCVVASPEFAGKAVVYADSLGAGQKLKMDLRLEPVESLGNPGEFDSRTYYRVRGVYYTAQADRIKLQEAGNPPWTQHARTVLTERIRSLLPAPEAGILTAIMLGEDGELDEEVRTEFQNMGISHILVVSGLHISLVYGFLSRLLSRKLTPRHASAAGIAAMWLYALMTGAAVSTVRASILCTVSAGQRFWGARQDPLNTLAASALILLTINPLYCLDIGFQLSFGAVLSIQILQSVFKRFFWLGPGLRERAAPVMAVSAGTAPLSAYYFYRWSPYSLLLNFLIVPGIGFIFASGAGMLMLSAVWKEGAAVLAGGVACLLAAVRILVRAVSGWPGAVWCTGRPDVLLLVGYYGFLAVLLWKQNLAEGKRKKAAGAVVAAAALMAAAVLLIRSVPGRRWECTFLNVGQGDCCVLEAGGQVWLIDAGPGYRNALKPYLQSRGISIIDGVFISHGDWDHTEGAAALLEDPDFQIRNWFWPAGALHENSRMEQMAAVAAAKGAAVRRLEKGSRIVSGWLQIECLAPDRQFVYADENSASMVLAVTDGRNRLLFCGDADQISEERFARSAGRCDVVKLGHHGSATSSGNLLLERTEPVLAVISCDRNGPYGHPHRETLERLDACQIHSLVTDDVGAVRLSLDPRGWRYRTGPS